MLGLLSSFKIVFIFTYALVSWWCDLVHQKSLHACDTVFVTSQRGSTLPERPKHFQPFDEFCKNTDGTTADNCAANTTELNSLGLRILGVKYWWKQHWQQAKKQELRILHDQDLWSPGSGDDQELKNKRWAVATKSRLPSSSYVSPIPLRRQLTLDDPLSAGDATL